jgi:hypothetical protein
MQLCTRTPRTHRHHTHAHVTNHRCCWPAPTRPTQTRTTHVTSTPLLGLTTCSMRTATCWSPKTRRCTTTTCSGPTTCALVRRCARCCTPCCLLITPPGHPRTRSALPSHLHTHTHTHTPTHTYTHLYTPIHTYTPTHTYTHLHTPLHTPLHACTHAGTLSRILSTPPGAEVSGPALSFAKGRGYITWAVQHPYDEEGDKQPSSAEEVRGRGLGSCGCSVAALLRSTHSGWLTPSALPTDSATARPASARTPTLGRRTRPPACSALLCACAHTCTCACACAGGAHEGHGRVPRSTAPHRHRCWGRLGLCARRARARCERRRPRQAAGREQHLCAVIARRACIVCVAPRPQ